MIINTDLIYPIGSIYISVNATNPSKYFGGTWEQITSDAYLKIVTQNAGSLGGTSSDHKIPLTSIPSHKHLAMYSSSSGTTQAGATYDGVAFTLGRAVDQSGRQTFTNNQGGSQAYYPYYYGVYVWKRTA